MSLGHKVPLERDPPLFLQYLHLSGEIHRFHDASRLKLMDKMWRVVRAGIVDRVKGQGPRCQTGCERKYGIIPTRRKLSR